LTGIQKLALEHVWLWFGDFWSEDMVATERLDALREEVPHRLKALPLAGADDRDASIVEFVAILRDFAGR
jgi:hypothetical protein